MRQRRPNARHFVRNDRHADTCPADQDAALFPTARDLLRDFDRDVGIIALRRLCYVERYAEIANFDSAFP